MECDFCSSPNVTRQFECMDFDADSADAGVIYDGTRDTEGPTTLVLHSINFWAACEACAKYVDAEDLDGLLGHVIAVFAIRGLTISLLTAQHLQHTYELFFRNKIRVAQ